MTHHLGYPPHNSVGPQERQFSQRTQCEGALRANRVLSIWRFLGTATAVSSRRSWRSARRRVAGLDDVDRVSVRARAEYSHNPADAEASLRGGGVLDAYIGGDFKRSGGGESLAGPCTRERLSNRVLRRAVREVTRGGCGEDACGLRGLGDRHAGGETGARSLDRSYGGGPFRG